jgi:hypothetical protein
LSSQCAKIEIEVANWKAKQELAVALISDLQLQIEEKEKVHQDVLSGYVHETSTLMGQLNQLKSELEVATASAENLTKLLEYSFEE